MDCHTDGAPAAPPSNPQPNGLRDWPAELAYIRRAAAKRGVTQAFHFSSAHFISYCERRALEAQHEGNVSVADLILAACKDARQ